MCLSTKCYCVLLAGCTALMIGMGYGQLMDEPRPLGKVRMILGKQTPPTTYICEEQCQKLTGDPGFCFQWVACDTFLNYCGEERTDPQSRMKCVESPSTMTDCKNEVQPAYCYKSRLCICTYVGQVLKCKPVGTPQEADKRNYSNDC